MLPICIGQRSPALSRLHVTERSPAFAAAAVLRCWPLLASPPSPSRPHPLPRGVAAAADEAGESIGDKTCVVVVVAILLQLLLMLLLLLMHRFNG